MIKPTFTKALSLHDEVFSSSDLEEKILAFGLGILPYGVIDKDSDLLTNCFEDIEYKAIITSLQAFLSKQNPSEPIEIFWLDTTKYTLKCHVAFALAHVADIISEDWDCWIFAEHWAIEYYHENMLSYFVKS